MVKVANKSRVVVFGRDILGRGVGVGRRASERGSEETTQGES